jgi:hypothetical protein
MDLWWLGLLVGVALVWLGHWLGRSRPSRAKALALERDELKERLAAWVYGATLASRPLYADGDELVGWQMDVDACRAEVQNELRCGKHGPLMRAVFAQALKANALEASLNRLGTALPNLPAEIRASPREVLDVWATLVERMDTPHTLLTGVDDGPLGVAARLRRLLPPSGEPATPAPSSIALPPLPTRNRRRQVR